MRPVGHQQLFLQPSCQFEQRDIRNFAQDFVRLPFQELDQDECHQLMGRAVGQEQETQQSVKLLGQRRVEVDCHYVIPTTTDEDFLDPKRCRHFHTRVPTRREDRCPRCEWRNTGQS